MAIRGRAGRLCAGKPAAISVQLLLSFTETVQSGMAELQGRRKDPGQGPQQKGVSCPTKTSWR